MSNSKFSQDGVSGAGGSQLASLDMICFSHLRWNFVFQRPQHLLSRFARRQNVFFMEEPLFEDSPPHIREYTSREDVRVLTPVIPRSKNMKTLSILKAPTSDYVRKNVNGDFITWYYTPMAHKFTRSLDPAFTVYDCMDELANFLGAPEDMREQERELLLRCDVVFTGGYSLFEAKSALHGRVYPFPSSIDRAHFAQGVNSALPEPPDQASIPGPKAGYFGVIDERFDSSVLSAVAEARPDWSFVILGPVAKISSSALHKRPNIHYLGHKHYDELPEYLAHWDVAMLPFAMNAATRFISPTKVPEYLSAMKPVISTPIRDVYRDYGKEGIVFMADSARMFADLLDRAALQHENEVWRRRVDKKLFGLSWDMTWTSMAEIMETTYLRKEAERASSP